MNSKLDPQGSTKLKICGITQIDQAIQIASLGVNAIGLIAVQNSARYVKEKTRDKLFKELIDVHPDVERVLVVANMDEEEIARNLNKNGSPSIIQLHGNESKQQCENLKKNFPKVSFWKAFRIKYKDDLLLIKEYESIVDGVLLDAWSDKQLGGTGKRIDINLLKEHKFMVPWWIAGGINSQIIPEIINTLAPYGIDASSKLEEYPGVKNMRKVEELIEAIRNFQN